MYVDKVRAEVETDPRIHAPQYKSLLDHYRDYLQWQKNNPIVSKYQLYVTNQILSTIQGIRVWKLQDEIRERYLLSQHDTKALLNHILFDNKFCEIERVDKRRDRWLVWKAPKQKKNAVFPRQVFIPGFVRLAGNHLVA